MSISNTGASEVGQVKVYTTSHRGFTPEEIAERAIDKIVYVGDQSHPLVTAQARAFRDKVFNILVQYLREAQESERVTICAKLDQQGLEDISNVIRRL